MPICNNCGRQMSKKEVFCKACGTRAKDYDIYQQTKDNQGNDSEKRKQLWEGNIHKCPSCGCILESYAAKCPVCGQELRNVKAVDSAKDFEQSLQRARSLDEKQTLILNYTIPNAKEDILEFMLKTRTNLNASTDLIVFNAWVEKFKEAYRKAEIVFSDDALFSKAQQMYREAQPEIRHKRRKLTPKNATKQSLSFMPIVLPSFGENAVVKWFALIGCFLVIIVYQILLLLPNNSPNFFACGIGVVLMFLCASFVAALAEDGFFLKGFALLGAGVMILLSIVSFLVAPGFGKFITEALMVILNIMLIRLVLGID